MRTSVRRSAAIAGGTVLGALVLGGVGFAAIPNADGSVTMCRNNSTGLLRAINVEAGATCKATEKRIRVAKTGATGPRGPQGLQGPQGPPGVTGFGTDTNKGSEGKGAECTIGQLILTAAGVSSTPVVGLPANGQELSIETYESLFAVIGTTYGGNGTTTFKVPDLRKAAPNKTTYSICVYGRYPSQGLS